MTNNCLLAQITQLNVINFIYTFVNFLIYTYFIKIIYLQTQFQMEPQECKIQQNPSSQQDYKYRDQQKLWKMVSKHIHQNEGIYSIYITINFKCSHLLCYQLSKIAVYIFQQLSMDINVSISPLFDYKLFKAINQAEVVFQVLSFQSSDHEKSEIKKKFQTEVEVLTNIFIQSVNRLQYNNNFELLCQDVLKMVKQGLNNKFNVPQI